MQPSFTAYSASALLDLGRYPCPLRYREIFGFSCITLALSPTGDYVFMDRHRSERIVLVDSETLSQLADWRAFHSSLAQTGS